jgi:hypothetical protein
MKKNIPPTFREMIEKAIVELSEFKAELTEEDMIAFNTVIDIVRKKVLSTSGEPFLPGKFDPVDFLLLSILIEQQKEIDVVKETMKKNNINIVKK